VFEHFKSHAPRLAALVVAKRAGSEKIAKADGPTDSEIDEAMGWDAFVDGVEGHLADAYLEAETVSADVSGMDASFALTSDAAVAYAEKRAAEMVGMRNEDGALVPNPNPKWSIPKTVREDVRDAIKFGMANGMSERDISRSIESETFWNWRADTIARTEVAIALNSGASAVYRDAGVEKVEIADGDGCLEDGHDDEQDGVNGQVWAIEKFEEFPIGHPNCRRDGIPIVVTDVNAEGDAVDEES
jgi:hypothetical protein